MIDYLGEVVILKVYREKVAFFQMRLNFFNTLDKLAFIVNPKERGEL
jgi:hypothetical protein